MTLRIDEEYYPMLFLHLKSLTDPKGFGLRDEMLQLALKFRMRLDSAAGGSGKANYLFVGDLNTMGLDYPYTQHDISAAMEINELKRRAKHYTKNMTVLDKSEANTWWGGSTSTFGPSNLDHVVAANHLMFKDFGGAPVDVRGWPQEVTDADKDAWVEKFPDHALLYFEVQKV